MTWQTTFETSCLIRHIIDVRAIYSLDQTQANQILHVFGNANRQRDNPSPSLIVSMISSTGQDFGSGFDPTGWQDALDYLPCYCSPRRMLNGAKTVGVAQPAFGEGQKEGTGSVTRP